MRVKIAYSIDLEQVESEVKELMQRALTYVEEANTEAFEATCTLDTDKSDIPSIVKKLESSRVKLAKADAVISDCYDILIGLHSTLQKIAEEAENEQV